MNKTLKREIHYIGNGLFYALISVLIVAVLFALIWIVVSWLPATIIAATLFALFVLRSIGKDDF